MASWRIVVDDTDERIRYDGDGWFLDADGSQDHFGNYGPPYNETLHGTKTSSSFSFSFNGTNVSIWGSINLAKVDATHYDPSWECFVDSVSIGAAKPFAYAENNWSLCGKGNLADGPHEITLNVSISEGHTFWFDAIRFLPSPSDVYDSEVVMVQNNDPSIQYGSGWRALSTDANLTTTHGSTAQFNFTGTGLSWVGWIPTEYPHTNSSGSYSIDGGKPTVFPLKGLSASDPTTSYYQTFFTTPQLSAGPHSLLVTYDGDAQHTPLTLDHIYLSNKIIPASPSGSTNPTQSPSPSSVNGAKKPIGAIVGGVLGGLAVLLLLAIVLVYLRRRRRPENRITLPTPSQSALSPFMSTHESTPSESLGSSSRPVQPFFKGSSGLPAGSGYGWGSGPAMTGVVATQVQRKRSERERRPAPEREIIRHEDSGIRLTEAPVEIPPLYTPG